MLVTAFALMTNGMNMFENVAALDSMIPLTALPETNVSLEQEFAKHLSEGTGNEKAKRTTDFGSPVWR